MARHSPEVDRWLDEADHALRRRGEFEAGRADLEAAVRAWCEWKGGSAAYLRLPCLELHRLAGLEDPHRHAALRGRVGEPLAGAGHGPVDALDLISRGVDRDRQAGL